MSISLLDSPRVIEFPESAFCSECPDVADSKCPICGKGICDVHTYGCEGDDCQVIAHEACLAPLEEGRFCRHHAAQQGGKN